MEKVWLPFFLPGFVLISDQNSIVTRGRVRKHFVMRCTSLDYGSRLAIRISVSHYAVLQEADKRKGIAWVNEEDRLTMVFETSAQGDVSALNVTFRAGFAHKRAPLLGKILGEVTKNVASSKAHVLTQAFAKYANLAGGSVADLGSGGHMVSIGGREGSSDGHHVRITSHPCERAGDVCVDMCVL
jgi:hypothetical protein